MSGGESKIIYRIMRDGEWVKVDSTDAEIPSRIDLDDAVAQGFSPATGLVVRDVASFADVSIARPGGDEDRTVEVFHQHSQATHMVTVLMGDENAVKRVGILADLIHAACNFPCAQAGVDQHARAVGDKQHRIAGGAAAEYAKFHFEKKSILGLPIADFVARASCA